MSVPILRRYSNANHDQRRQMLVYSVMLAHTCSKTEAEGVVALFEAGVLRTFDQELEQLENPFRRGMRFRAWNLAKATVGGRLFMTEMRLRARFQDAQRRVEGWRKGERTPMGMRALPEETLTDLDHEETHADMYARVQELWGAQVPRKD